MVWLSRLWVSHKEAEATGSVRVNIAMMGGLLLDKMPKSVLSLSVLARSSVQLVRAVEALLTRRSHLARIQPSSRHRKLVKASSDLDLTSATTRY